MTKATSTTTTAVPANIPGLPSASRRRLLAGSGVATIAAAFALPLATSPVHAAPADPVVAMYAQWQALEDRNTVLSARHSEIRDAMVARHGELRGYCDNAIHAAWQADPRWPALDTATQEVNDLCDQSTDLLDVMTETPATSLEGVRCKLLAAVHVLKFIERPGFEAECHDTMALAVMRDAVRVLGGSAVA